MPRSRTLLAALAALVAVGATASATPPAGPATVGKLFVGSASECRGKTWIQTETPGKKYLVPGNGVIVTMRARLVSTEPGQTLTFKVARLDPVEDLLRIVATTPPVSIPEGTATVEKATRIRVRKGDAIGYYFQDVVDVICARQHPNSNDWHYSFDDGEVATGDLMQGISSDQTQFSVQAIVEPDVDKDGYGDLTQDKCPTDPTTHKPCATSRPQTKIYSSSGQGHRVTFRFGADEPATFRCRIDDGRRRPCVSPKTVELSSGRHTLYVAATDRYGNTDVTPDSRSVRIP